MTQMFNSVRAAVRVPFMSSPFPLLSRARGLFAAIFGILALAASAAAQPPGRSQDSADGDVRFRLEPVTVTAEKEPRDKQKVPASVTAVSKATLDAAAVRIVSDAAIVAPNTFFTEWTARKLSNARFRGVSSSPNNPGVTTFIDGVPQLNTNSSSIELLDVDQIELVRGPQSALYGRNTLGGLINVTSSRPSMATWTGALNVPLGNYGAWATRGTLSGPIVENRLSLGVAFAQVSRDGFTVNDVTGDRIDSRSASSGKIQLLWLPNPAWEGRVIVSGERARDGDYGLNDVASLRERPFRAARDFAGTVDRDVFGTTVLLRRSAGPVTFTSTTGVVNWKTRDITDLDYTPQPIVTRDNTEEDFQFTQEVRFASSDSAPIALSDRTQLRWQAGVLVFTQAYDQDAINSYSPFVVAPVAIGQHTPLSSLDDAGVGVFGRATVTVGNRVDLTAGGRIDYENKNAAIRTFYEPAIAPPTEVNAERSFSNVSPQLSAAYRLRSDTTVYGTVGSGFKAGGFNAVSPAGAEAYGEELTWHLEGGLKTLYAGGRVSTNAAVFYIDWDDLQLNVPDPAVPAQFYIANVGGAKSKGFELEAEAKAAPGLDVFGSVGYTRARFGSGSVSSGASVAGNRIPNTPDYTVSAGIQYSRPVGPATIVGRAESVFYGSFSYDDRNTLEQEAYSLVNFRLAATGRRLTGEIVLRNAFDTHYIPLAFPYPNFAPRSGFVGEMGPPRTVAVSAGIRF